MTKKTWRSLFLMVGVMLLAAGAVLFWPSAEPGAPGPSTDGVQVERESAAGPKFRSEAFRHMDYRGHFSMITNRK